MNKLRKQSIKRYRMILVFGFLLFGFLISGCVSSTTSTTPTKISKPDKAVASIIPAFASNDYILHKMKKDQNVQQLASHYLGSKEAAWRIIEANPGMEFADGDLVVVPLKEGPLGGLLENGYQTVPVFCYHRFKPSCKSSLCVPTDLFDKQMAYLKDNGYQTISLSMLYEFTRFKKALPPKSVVITIDDGYRSGYSVAAPILKKYGFTATLFIYTDFVGASKNAVTWDQLRELKSQGFEIGSHTLSHPDLTRQLPGETDEEYDDRIKKELAVSKSIIDSKMGQDTLFIAWPFGKYNTKVLELSEQSGYTLGFTVDRGGNSFFQDPMTFKRDQVLSRDMKSFTSRLKTFKKVDLR